MLSTDTGYGMIITNTKQYQNRPYTKIEIDTVKYIYIQSVFWLWILSLLIPVRITIAEYITPLGDVSPFLTEYLYSFDILAICLVVGILWIIRKIPFTEGKSVDSLSLITLGYVSLSIWGAMYPVLSFVSLIRLFYMMVIMRYTYRIFTQDGIRWLQTSLFLGGTVNIVMSYIQLLSQQSVQIPLILQSNISPLVSGIGKVTIQGQEYIRVAGTFPHANVLAFYLISWLWLIWSSSQPIWKRYSGYAFIIGVSSMFDHYLLTNPQIGLLGICIMIALRYPFIYPVWVKVSISIVIIGVLCATFSKTGLVLLSMMIFYQVVSRKPMFHVEHFAEKWSQGWILYSFPLLTMSLFGGWIGIQAIQGLRTIALRAIYWQDATMILQQNIWLGVGLKNYITALPIDGRPVWQYEPVHNVGMLLISELGVVFIPIFLLWIVYGISIVLRYEYASKR